MTIEGKRQSIPLTEGPSRAAARSYLRGSGFKKDDLHKPIIGVANTWTEIGTCNVHLREIAEALKEGIREAGGTPMEFNTVTISDGITMGTQGMKASLVSREVIADSIELVARGNLFDGLGRHWRMRQEYAGHHYGALPARHSGDDALRRVNCARQD